MSSDKNHNVLFRVRKNLNRRRKAIGITWPRAAERGIEAAEQEKKAAETPQ